LVSSVVLPDLWPVCWAWAAWQFFQVPRKDGARGDIPGEWSNYSGDFPLWRMSYDILRYFRRKLENELDWSFRRLFMMPENAEAPWLTYQQFSNLVGSLTDQIVAEENWQPIIDEIWNSRQVEDFNRGKNSKKRDFLRSWNHDRTAKHISLDEIAQGGTKLDDDLLHELAEPRAEFEEKVLSQDVVDTFRDSLSEKDKAILQMRLEDRSLKEIADKLGYKTPGAVSERIKKLATKYEKFASDQYDDFLDEH